MRFSPSGSAASASALGKCWEACCSEKCSCCERSDENRICPEYTTVGIFSALHLIMKPALIIVNSVYFAMVGFGSSFNGWDILGFNQTSDLKATGAGFSNIITFASFGQEIAAIVFLPIYGFLYWIGCCRRNKEARSCGKYMEYLRFLDLEVAFFYAPFSNVNLFYLGGLWHFATTARLIIYSVTFAAAIIAGIRFIFNVFCIICCECACSDKAVALQSYKHLFVDIGLKMIAIALKLMTCSSALSTYLKIAILVDSLRFCVAYFSFTILRGVTAVFSLTFTAAMIRWSALKQNEKESDKPFSKLLGCLDKYAPHSHISFILDMLAYGGLLALNCIIVYGINNNDFIL